MNVWRWYVVNIYLHRAGYYSTRRLSVWLSSSLLAASCTNDGIFMKISPKMSSDKEDTSKFWKWSASGYGSVQACLKIGYLRCIQQTLHSHQQVAPQNSVWQSYCTCVTWMCAPVRLMGNCWHCDDFHNVALADVCALSVLLFHHTFGRQIKGPGTRSLVLSTDDLYDVHVVSFQVLIDQPLKEKARVVIFILERFVFTIIYLKNRPRHVTNVYINYLC